jgi:hypothetical protein
VIVPFVNGNEILHEVDQILFKVMFKKRGTFIF